MKKSKQSHRNYRLAARLSDPVAGLFTRALASDRKKTKTNLLEDCIVRHLGPLPKSAAKARAAAKC